MTKIRAFSPNWGTFFQFSKKGRGDLIWIKQLKFMVLINFCCCLFRVRYPLCEGAGRRGDGEGAWFFYSLECKSGIYSCVFTTITLEVIENRSYLCLFSSLVTIPVQQYRFWNIIVGSVGAAFLTCFIGLKGFAGRWAKFQKGDAKRGDQI